MPLYETIICVTSSVCLTIFGSVLAIHGYDHVIAAGIGVALASPLVYYFGKSRAKREKRGRER